MSTYQIPMVVERTPNGERSYDVFSRPAETGALKVVLTRSA